MAIGRDMQSVPFLPTQPKAPLPDGSRLDRRALEEFREVFLQVGVISQAAGAAYVEFSDTKVMVGVYGPRPTDRRSDFSESGRLQCDVKVASFATQTRTRITQSAEEKEYSGQLQTALEGAVLLETFPKALVDVYAVILESDGSDLAAAITAAGLALADAGVAVRDVVSACSVSRVAGRLLLDPTAQEQAQADGSVLLALMPAHNQVTQMVLTGEWSSAQCKEALSLCLGGCAQLDALTRATLRAQLEPAPA